MPQRSPRSSSPLRVVTAVPLCDGHDSAITTINLELARNGVEVIYLGYHQPASAIARAAVQEDAQAIGISSYNGGHVVFFREVLAQLRARGGTDIAVFGGGGGTITAADARAMHRAGVDRIFYPGTALDEIASTIRTRYTTAPRPNAKLSGDRRLARAISLAELAGGRRVRAGKSRPTASRPACTVIGVAGPGGAGKSTLIDELTARFLRQSSVRRIAILANDPSYPDGRGAILGDRVSALYAQDDRVFFRSLATRGSRTGISAATPATVDALRQSGQFDLVFVESVGIGQDGDPFGTFGPGPTFVDTVMFVLSPHYGGRIQLQKISLLAGANLVVLNKCDDPRAATAKVEITERLAAQNQPSALHTTVAAQHDDSGTDTLHAAVAGLTGLEPRGGERACQLQINE